MVDTSWRSAPGLHPDVPDAFDAACTHLSEAGAQLREIDLAPSTSPAMPRVSRNPSRPSITTAQDLAERWDDYGPGVRCFLAMGAFYDGATYVRAQRVRAERAAALADQLTDVRRRHLPHRRVAGAVADRHHAALIPLFFTKLWNAVGFPAVLGADGVTTRTDSVPALPLGLQIVGLRAPI